MEHFSSTYWYMCAIKKKKKSKPKRKRFGFRKQEKQHQNFQHDYSRIAANSQDRKQSVYTGARETVLRQKMKSIIPDASEYILRGELDSW